MGKLVPKKKSFKLSAKLKARCKYLEIPVPLTNALRKVAIREKISLSNVGSWPEYMAQQDAISPTASRRYKELLVGYEAEYENTYRSDKKEASAAKALRRRELQVARQEANRIALVNRKARQAAASEKAIAAAKKAELSKQEKHRAREAEAKNRKAARIARFEAKLSRMKGRREAA
jgi:vacuolar-type H+-ATPase subunit I/STV1